MVSDFSIGANRNIQFCPFLQTEPPSIYHLLHHVRPPQSFDVFFAGTQDYSNRLDDLRDIHVVFTLKDGAG
jgi:hypothetical protein